MAVRTASMPFPEIATVRNALSETILRSKFLRYLPIVALSRLARATKLATSMGARCTASGNVMPVSICKRSSTTLLWVLNIESRHSLS